MNLVKYLVIIAVIILIYWLVFSQPIRPKIKPANLAREITNEIQNSADNAHPKNQTIVNNLDVNQSHILNKNTLSTQDPDLSYLEAYRNYMYFHKCRHIISQVKQNKNLETEFINKVHSMKHWASQIAQETTTIQIKIFNEFIEKCQSFLLNSNEKYHNGLDRLLKTYQSIDPETQEEQNLFNGLALMDEYNNKKKLLRTARMGESTLDQTKVTRLKKHIDILIRDLERLRSLAINSDTQVDHFQSNIINNKIQSLREILNKNKLFNNDKITALYREQLLIKSTMYEFLKQNISPDVFLLFTGYLDHNSTLHHEFFNNANIHDDILQREIYHVGKKLVACAMNYPCGSDSLFSIDYCVNLKSPHLDTHACGKSIEEYYFNYLLGPNQLTDIDNYLNYMLANYAKK
ncbi:MAG: hypothetical protein L3J53_04160 [Proteobacteria bacterium]|nr:hypothetical protein [Pseudomonadota bacterium]